MSTDREVLIELLGTVDRHAGWAVPEAERALRQAANRARRHLLLVEGPDGDCAARIAAASSASYAAGVAHGRGAHPEQRPGSNLDA